MPEITQAELDEYHGLQKSAATKRATSAIRSKARSNVLKKYKDEVTSEIKRLGG